MQLAEVTDGVTSLLAAAKERNIYRPTEDVGGDHRALLDAMAASALTCSQGKISILAYF